ncbi:MAG: hypothetical protein JWN41_1822, partial [Thermoleophilia bacterium]|nr:hypothetical protein [Thermoleophilia bacterium]
MVEGLSFALSVLTNPYSSIKV